MQGVDGARCGTGYPSTSLVIGLGERFEIRLLSDFHSIKSILRGLVKVNM